MLTNIIIAVSFIPIWPVLYFILRNNTKPKKNIILGVTLPYTAHNDPDTQELCRAFRTALNVVMLPLLVLIVPPFLWDSSGASMTWFMTWLLLAIILPFVVFAVYRSRLMALKRARGWGSTATGQRLADVKAAAIPPKKLSGLWFLIPLLCSLIPVAHCLWTKAEAGELLLYGSLAAMVPLFWLCCHFTYHVRTELFNDDPSLTMALTRVRRYNWSKFFLISAWLTAALILLLWLLPESTLSFLLLTLGYTVVLLVLSMQTELSARAAQQKLTEGITDELYADEDDRWIMGMFYYNPHDKHFLVNDRVGMNMSVNLARPAAKVLMAFSILCILSMPFFGLWMWAEETTPSTLQLSETTLTARHTGEEYAVPLSSIRSVELIDALPSMRRTWGTGFENLYKGRFSAGSYGSCFVCLQPKDPPFLVVKTKDETFIFNDRDSAVTRAAYDALAP